MKKYIVTLAANDILGYRALLNASGIMLILWLAASASALSNPGAALSDYQILISLSSAGFPAGAKADGADVRFTDAGGAELAYWIESWDSSGKNARIG